MQMFIDTANVEEVRKVVPWGAIAGATTNPKILSSEGSNFDLRERVLEIVELVQGPVSVEVLSETHEEMLEEARTYASWHSNIVVKIPMGVEGMGAVNRLEREGIATNVTGVMATNQALLASLAGATYVSIFFGRISDLGTDPTQVIRESADLLHAGTSSKIIVGSIRNLMDINRSFLAGADFLTVSYAFLEQMAHHPKTVETICEFNESWANVRGGHLAIAVAEGEPEMASRR